MMEYTTFLALFTSCEQKYLTSLKLCSKVKITLIDYHFQVKWSERRKKTIIGRKEEENRSLEKQNTEET